MKKAKGHVFLRNNRELVSYEGNFHCFSSSQSSAIDFFNRLAHLQDSNLHIDSLQGVNLRNADLSRANLAADYDRAGKLKVSANLTGANLTGAILAWANLTGAILERANLSGTNLSNTDLSGANLKGAYVLVNGKVSVSAFMSQVEQQTPRLHGTIMPDGSIHP